MADTRIRSNWGELESLRQASGAVEQQSNLHESCGSRIFKVTMSSTSSTASTAGLCLPNYRYGKQARIRTSWTDDNPGRRFFGCAYWKRGGDGCGYFEWYDPPIKGRLRSLILSMLKKEREKEVKIRELEAKTKELVKVAQIDAAKSFGSCNIL